MAKKREKSQEGVIDAVVEKSLSKTAKKEKRKASKDESCGDKRVKKSKKGDVKNKKKKEVKLEVNGAAKEKLAVVVELETAAEETNDRKEKKVKRQKNEAGVLNAEDDKIEEKEVKAKRKKEKRKETRDEGLNGGTTKGSQAKEKKEEKKKEKGKEKKIEEGDKGKQKEKSERKKKNKKKEKKINDEESGHQETHDKIEDLGEQVPEVKASKKRKNVDKEALGNAVNDNTLVSAPSSMPLVKKAKVDSDNLNTMETTLIDENDGYSSGGKQSNGGTAAKAFQRVKADEWLGKKGSWDNSYEGTFGQDGWGYKAQQILGQVRGKDFRHEKTKKKRGSYRGGTISSEAVFSYKFDSEDE